MLIKNLTTWSSAVVDATQHGGSLVRKKQDFIVPGKRIFVGLEDSKRTWKGCVRSAGMVVHETSMPAVYDNLRRYLQNRYPGCQTQLMYEAEVINLYFGLNYEKALTLEEIGARFSLTRERVRQIKEKAIRRLRHASRSRSLRAYLN
jgi:hypothetical protein